MTPKTWLPMILLLSCIFTGTHATAAPTQKDELFSRFYADFQQAVKAGDKEKVANVTDFEGFTWEESESLRQIKSKEAFLKNYDKMFSSTIKSKIASSKPEKVDDDNYFIIWHTKNLEYSLCFSMGKDGSYKFEGLTKGPY
jgi:hypothetical protein